MVARVVSPRCFSMYSWKGAIWPCTEERARGSLSSGNQASTCAALRSRPRARAIWETLSPACQCRKSSTTSTTANILLAIRAPSLDSFDSADGRHSIGADLETLRWGIV